MQQSRRTVALSLLIVALLAVPSLAQTVTVMAGATPGGAFYTIAVPPSWNGDLVFYNHGFDLSPPSPGPDLGPLQELQLLEGYAVAASSYRQVGWAVFDTNADLEELYDVFVANFGEPNHTLVFGVSLGGIVTARAIEEADLGHVAGALSICGAVAGSRNWDAGLDFRLIYDAICQNVPGANIPGGARGLPLGSPLTPTDIGLAANACFGHDLPAEVRTAAQQTRLDQFVRVTQIPQSFINADLGYTTFAMSELVFNPDKLGGRIGTGNRNVDYGDPFINANIQRVGARASQRRLLRDNYTPSGEVGDTKIVSIHTDKDGLVIVENESEYASLVPPGNLTVGVVEEAVPTHCGFSTAETVAAWETLRGWVAGDPQPSALTLQIMCLALQPSFGGSCRFNPFFQIPDMDGRVRPRNPGNQVRAKTSAAKASAAAPAAAGEAASALPSRAPEPQTRSTPAGQAGRAAEVARRLTQRAERRER